MLESGETEASRISQMIKELGFKTPNAFAVSLRKRGSTISQASISRFINGKNKPLQNFYDVIEKEFGYSAKWIRFGKGEKLLKDVVNDLNVANTKRNESPIYGEVLCGAPASQWQQDNVIKYIPTDVKDNSAFGVIAKGSSMEPYINDKDILICVDNPHLIKDKSAVVTVFKSEPDTTNTNAKLIKKDSKNKNIILYSINTRNPPEVYKESEILKIYKVVRIIREVK